MSATGEASAISANEREGSRQGNVAAPHPQTQEQRQHSQFSINGPGNQTHTGSTNSGIYNPLSALPVNEGSSASNVN